MYKSILELYFEYTYFELSLDIKKCNYIIGRIVKENVSDLELIDQGILLFMISEYTRNFEKDEFIKSNEVQILVGNILENWNVEKIKRTSTLGCIYGGLRGVNRFLKNDEISKTVMSIKEYVFKNLIEKGMLCSDSTKTKTDGEMLLSCVPFGMFEPEDLVFVEAVRAINEKRNRDQLDEKSKLFLAWYYVEQGTYEITREILKNTSPDSYLYKLIFTKLESKGGVDEKVIIHKPMGNNNIYEPGNDEMFPKLVTENDEVIIKAVAFPLSSDNEVVLESSGVIYKGEIVDDLYWQFSFGPFEKNVTVDYKLYFLEDTRISTEEYSFEVLELYQLEKFDFYRKFENEILFVNDDIQVKYSISNDGVLDIHVEENSSSNENLGTITSGKKIVLQNQGYALEIDPEYFNFTYFDGQKELIKSREKNWLQIYKGKNGIEQINCKFLSDDGKYYGFGERYNSLNQNGNTPDNFVYNQYKEQGLKTYIPMPFFVSNKGYGVLANTSNYSKFDMEDSVKGEISIEVEDKECQLVIMPGSLNEVIKKNADVVGYPEMLPKWAFGPWMSSNNWDSEKEVRKQVAIANELEIPSTVLVIEAWSDEATFYIFNDAKYEEKSGEEYLEYEDFTFPSWGRWPEPKKMVEHLHDNNLKCILWQIPIIKQISSLHHLQKDKDEKTFIEKKYGVTNHDDTPYRLPEGWFKDSLLMDFSNEEGKKWWFNKRKYLIEDLKVDGFKTDGGEFVFGKDLKFADGRTGREMRNEYANDYVGAYYNFAKRNNGITFSRAGYKGANQYPAHWAGDEKSTFDAFKRSILAGLSSGISGLPFWGWDLAGFSGDVPTAELFIRSTQMAAFCPIMQYHAESKGEFNQDRTPWNIRDRSGDDRAVSVYRYFANIRMNLLPYIYDQALKSSATGLPLMKALVLNYEDDRNVHEIWDQYMFGENLMVAPIINEGETQREIYFPKGRWINLFGSEVEFGPNKINVEAALEEISVYVKENSVIPLNLNENFEFGGRISNNLDEYNNLCFRVFGDDIKDYKFTDDLENVVNISVNAADRTTNELEITIKSAVDTIHIILDKDIKRVKVNDELHETKLLTFNKHEVRIVEVRNEHLG